MLGVVCLAANLLSFAAVPRIQHQRKILGESIRKHRKRTKMSQEKLAEKAGLHPVYIGKVERGEQWVSLHALLRISAALGVRISEIVADL